MSTGIPCLHLNGFGGDSSTKSRYKPKKHRRDKKGEVEKGFNWMNGITCGVGGGILFLLFVITTLLYNVFGPQPPLHGRSPNAPGVSVNWTPPYTQK